eukprot:m.404335 g.404335  ORF g.404335 m.404335 type:complete len:51 (+) comp21196_c1_seq32:3545-3697(+)
MSETNPTETAVRLLLKAAFLCLFRTVIYVLSLLPAVYFLLFKEAACVDFK